MDILQIQVLEALNKNRMNMISLLFESFRDIY